MQQNLDTAGKTYFAFLLQLIEKICCYVKEMGNFIHSFLPGGAPGPGGFIYVFLMRFLWMCGNTPPPAIVACIKKFKILLTSVNKEDNICYK